MKEPTVAIILLNYNSYEYTKACLESLIEMKYNNYYIIIVDNDSQDDSYNRLIQYETEKIHVIESGKNAGFAYGNNIGIRYAQNIGYDYILLLNNDTIVTSDFMMKLVTTAEKYCGDITTCRIMYNDERNKIWYAGGEIDWFNQRAVHIGMNSFQYEDMDVKEVSFISGCCMLLSKNCINQIGELPEEYFMYYEDLDYCQRAINKGLKLLYNPRSIIYHCVGASGGGNKSPFVIEWSNRSRRKFIKKYNKFLQPPQRLLSFIYCEMRSIYSIMKSKNKYTCIKAYFKSFNN